MSENCGCCEGLEPLTPLATANRPGLNALAYRAGTHATFLTTMKARLSAAEYPPLAGLTTRAATDPAVAMLDAWATVADVLTFYQERSANEGYLRTAAERRSILELARLVGYEPRPGVAASAYLAFTLEDGHKLEIPVGTRAQSLPGPGELPQFFETAEKLEARAEWNSLAPRRSRPQALQPPVLAEDPDQTTSIYLKGVATNLGPNDPVLIDYVDRQAFFRVKRALPDPKADRTLVTLTPVAVNPPAALEVSSDFGDAIRLVAERYLDLERYGVSSEREMTRRVVAILQQLRSSVVERNEPPERVLALVRDRLTDLREEYTIAEGGAYRRLRPWVGGAVQEIENLTPASEEPSAARASEVPVKPPSENGRSPLGTLEGLLGPLTIPPSRQPASAQKLPRSLERSFIAPASDTVVPDAVTRLLTTLRPELRDTLYGAWEQAGTKRSAAQVYALRDAASPFGHSAPLKPIIKEENGTTIVDYEEWTLEKTTQEFEEGFQVRVRVDPEWYSSEDDLPKIEIGVTIEGDTQEVEPEEKMVTYDHLQNVDFFEVYFEVTDQTVEGNIDMVDILDDENRAIGKRFTVEINFIDRQTVVKTTDQVFLSQIG
jgi:hypothetical protein